MSAEGRLKQHQTKSSLVLSELREWIEQQLNERKVEPNSGLGQALRYVLKHWAGLTRFLSVAGAPLDNNIAERALKRAVLLRKNALFYKNEHGAAVGAILLSLIETCRLNQVSAWPICCGCCATERKCGPILVRPCPGIMFGASRRQQPRRWPRERWRQARLCARGRRSGPVRAIRCKAGLRVVGLPAGVGECPKSLAITAGGLERNV